MIKLLSLLTRKEGITHAGLASFERASKTTEMKALTDDGALFIGRIKAYLIEKRQIIPLPD